jgi:8-oxo-dGTP pyrophosphatase MutT (NUDIX family)
MMQDRQFGMNNNLDDDLPLPPAIPAATLVLFRERVSGPPELLVVERSTKMAFAGGAVVFPGGRIDDDDHAIAADVRFVGHSIGFDVEEAAARVAAIRETLEESGIAIGFAQPPTQDWINAARVRLHTRELFSEILANDGPQLALDHLIPFARWRPNFREARIFDTRFYIARSHPDTPEPVVDDTENVLSFWASAAGLLTAADDGRVKVIFPTRRNLERLAQFDDFASAEAHARSIPVEIICPYFEERDGERHLCIPTHLGYPVTSEKMATVVRGGQ